MKVLFLVIFTKVSRSSVKINTLYFTGGSICQVYLGIALAYVRCNDLQDRTSYNSLLILSLGTDRCHSSRKFACWLGQLHMIARGPLSLRQSLVVSDSVILCCLYLPVTFGYHFGITCSCLAFVMTARAGANLSSKLSKFEWRYFLYSWLSLYSNFKKKSRCYVEFYISILVIILSWYLWPVFWGRHWVLNRQGVANPFNLP